MSTEKSDSGKESANQPFDLDKLRELISLMEAHGLTEVDLSHQDVRWKLRRGPAEGTQYVPVGGFPPPMMAYPQQPAAQHPAHTPATVPAAVAGPVIDKDTVVIKSPTVGTYYEAPSPGDPPFVTVGSKVSQDSVVCIIEAMKVFNQITADLNGTVTELLVKNGDPVEFGQPLFRVRLG
jgi:acetyl-CoA carboxylase biotin carboxyl carrier protein